MGFIYQVTNKITKESYIGKSETKLAQRKREHRCEANTGSASLFHCAIREYGWDTFEWRVLIEREDPKELILCEVGLISILQTKTPHGYNMSDGGEGMMLGYLDLDEKDKKQEGGKRPIHPKNSKRKMASAARRRKLTAEQTRKRLVKHGI